MKEAKYWQPEGDKVRCGLCPHHCLIAPGRTGICGVRKNESNRLIALTFGAVSSLHLDPVEKKPLYHFKPGQDVLSFGSVGCNMGCLHCQNYSISQASPDSNFIRWIKPGDVLRLVKESGSRGVAWTYNEPTIWAEFVEEASALCKKEGYFTILVTNGFIEETPLRDMKGLIDASNIDVKGFTEDFYKNVCKARLAPILHGVEVSLELGIHVELTYLIIPGKNDKREEIDQFCKWAANLNDEMPIHFSRFHPDYKMLDTPMTPIATMEMAYQVAKDNGLRFVYLGNVRTDKEDTICPDCGTRVIRRSMFDVTLLEYDNGKCRKCGRSLNIVP